jgi:hypothetical protein
MSPNRCIVTVRTACCQSGRRGIWGGCLIACAIAGLAHAETIRLGGPRDVVVDVEDVKGGFSVVVEMRPVACFNEATNARVNRSKASLYGLAGLAQSLEINPDQVAAGSAVTGVKVHGVQSDGGRYRLRFFVPETAFNGLEDESGVGKATPLSTPFPSTATQKRSQLFTCVDDYVMTIVELKNTYKDRLTAVEQAVGDVSPGERFQDRLVSVPVELTEIDKEAEAAFHAVEQEFKTDLRVLSLEKESLLADLNAARIELAATSNKTRTDLQALATSSAARPTPQPPPPTGSDQAAPQ